MKFFYTLSLLALSLTIFSQRGKDGAVTFTNSNTIVNSYIDVTANLTLGTTTIPVSNSAGFAVGDLIFIAQMQGARTNCQWDTVWGDPNNAMSVPNSNNIDFGAIMNYNNCGKNEFAQINSIPNGTSLVVDCGLKSNYTYTYTNNQGGAHIVYGNIQVVKVPRYTSLIISGAGSITCPQWNGKTGGIAVIEVENNATLSSNPSFDVSGKGFRGGIKDNLSTFGGNKWGGGTSNQGGIKGESIAGDTSIYRNHGAVFSRGAIANGGGGGCAHNAGGGGGSNGNNSVTYNGYGNPVTGYNTIWNLESAGFAANISSGGGRGGYSFSNTNRNISTTAPGAITTTSNSWGGDFRRNIGGLGGRPLDYSSGNLYLGGGGGAGDGNENQAGAGGNGGGMVYVVCYGNLTGTGTILADGANGTSSTPGCGTNDGAGGAGGGGVIVLNVNGTTNLTAGTALSAKGGNGGNVVFNCVLSNSDGYGPGGGGGGGYITYSGTLPSNNISGGLNGIQSGNTSTISAFFPPNGATRGGSGSTGTISNYTLTASANQTVCANQTFTVTANSTQPGTSINWYNVNTGGTAIATGTAYAAPGYTAAGTYTLYAGACPGTYRQPIVITVGAGLSISVNSPTICPGQTTVLTQTSSATSYTWNTTATTASISVTPTSTTVYTVTGSNGTCSGVQTATVTVSPQPTVVVSSQTICAGNSATLTASGATNFTWSPGGQTTTSIVVTPTINSTYSITGATGSCTHSTTASVSITPTPTLTAASKTICPGQTATFTVSGASTYTWNPGSVTGSTYTIAPASNTTVSVIGASGTCTAQITASVTVNPSVTIVVNSPTICPGQTTTLTASGATSYTWNTGPTTNSIVVSPSSTTPYTITASNGSCVGTKTTTVTIATQPTVSVASASICSGNSYTLNASGATSYTWSPGGQTTTSIVVTPTTTTNYTITGTNGTCTNSTTASVSVTATPTLVANSATICPGQTATLTVGTATSYTWNPGNITGNTYTIAPASNTTVSVIGANSTCTAQTTASVTIGSGISIAVNNATICPGQTALLTPTSTATSYTWNTGANTNTLSVNPGTTTTYTISGTAGACSGSNTAVVTVIAQPTLSVAGTSICSGSSSTLTVSGSATNHTWTPGGQTTTSIVVTPTTTTNYTITGTNGTCTNSTTASVNVTATPTLVANSVTICPAQTATLTVGTANSYTWNPGGVTGNTYTIAPASNTTVSVIGANGACTAQTTASVTIGSAISIAINSATICEGQSATLTPTTSATSYTWSNSANTNSISVSPTSTTVFTLNASDGSCTGTNTATVTVNAVPVLTVTSNNICSGQTATLTVSGANTYTWSNGVNSNSQTVSPGSTTIYTVSGTSLAGCSNTAVVTTTVNVTSVPNVSITSSPTICAGQTATLTATGATNYTWSTTETSSTINVSPSTTTSYSVLGDNGGCTASYVTTVTVNTQSLTTYSLAVQTCPTETVNLFGAGTNSATTTYTWSNGANSYSQTVGPVNTTTYVVNGTSLSGCPVLSGTVIVNVDPISASFSGINTTLITVGETLNLTNTSVGATSIAWTYCNNGVSSNNTISIPLSDTGSCCIKLVATNATCKDSTTICIEVVEQSTINIPNVFTPNSDGSNDLFKITGTGIKTLNCVIFDRWGLKMFEWTGINGSWDGNVKAGVAPAGTYFYIINYTDSFDKTTTEKGFLNLFRN